MLITVTPLSIFFSSGFGGFSLPGIGDFRLSGIGGFYIFEIGDFHLLRIPDYGFSRANGHRSKHDDFGQWSRVVEI